MKIAIYVVGVVLLVLGTVSILQGLGAMSIISSAHHTRFLLGGVLVDLVGIAVIIYGARRS